MFLTLNPCFVNFVVNPPHLTKQPIMVASITSFLPYSKYIAKERVVSVYSPTYVPQQAMHLLSLCLSAAFTLLHTHVDIPSSHKWTAIEASTCTYYVGWSSLTSKPSFQLAVDVCITTADPWNWHGGDPEIMSASTALLIKHNHSGPDLTVPLSQKTAFTFSVKPWGDDITTM